MNCQFVVATKRSSEVARCAWPGRFRRFDVPTSLAVVNARSDIMTSQVLSIALGVKHAPCNDTCNYTKPQKVKGEDVSACRDTMA